MAGCHAMRPVLLLGVLLLAAAACAHATPLVHPAPLACCDEPAPPDRARVVFERAPVDSGPRTRDANRRPLHVVDTDGQLLGDLPQQSWFAENLSPGAHTFFAWHDGYLNRHYVSALPLTLEAGHTYFVRAVPGAGALWDLDLQVSSAPIDSAANLQAVQMDPGAARDWSHDEAAVVSERLALWRTTVRATIVGSRQAAGSPAASRR
jgi:hypothetical protein